jgi:hypothetical protein
MLGKKIRQIRPFLSSNVARLCYAVHFCTPI